MKRSDAVAHALNAGLLLITTSLLLNGDFQIQDPLSILLAVLMIGAPLASSLRLMQRSPEAPERSAGDLDAHQILDLDARMDALERERVGARRVRESG